MNADAIVVGIAIAFLIAAAVIIGGSRESVRCPKCRKNVFFCECDEDPFIREHTLP